MTDVDEMMMVIAEIAQRITDAKGANNPAAFRAVVERKLVESWQSGDMARIVREADRVGVVVPGAPAKASPTGDVRLRKPAACRTCGVMFTASTWREVALDANGQPYGVKPCAMRRDGDVSACTVADAANAPDVFYGIEVASG
jgi:hypothetical protein